jgi:hypothetical protein
MSGNMQYIHDRKISDHRFRKLPARDQFDKKPMHPDDFTAQLDWVKAKRFHEQSNY